MCTPAAYGQKQSGGKRLPASSAGARLDKAQRDAASASGGGTNGSTILAGTPRNSGVDALRKNTYMEV